MNTSQPYDWAKEDDYINPRHPSLPRQSHVINSLANQSAELKPNNVIYLRDRIPEIVESKSYSEKVKTRIYRFLGIATVTIALVIAYDHGRDKLESYVEENPNCYITGLDYIFCLDE